MTTLELGEMTRYYCARFASISILMATVWLITEIVSVAGANVKLKSRRMMGSVVTDQRVRLGPGDPNGEVNQFHGRHPGGVNFQFADGHVAFLKTSMNYKVFRAIAIGPEGFQRTLVIKRMLPHLSKDRAFVKWQELAEHQLADLAKDEREDFIRRYTHVEPGYRRIYFREEAAK